MSQTKPSDHAEPWLDEVQTRSEYIPAAMVSRLCGIHRARVAKVAAAAGVRIKALPGSPTRYHRGDVEALVARSLQVAGGDRSEEPNQIPTISTPA